MQSEQKDEITAERACARVRLEFSAAIEAIGKLAASNPKIAKQIYAHIEAALEESVYRHCQAAERRGIRLGRLAARQEMIKAAGTELRRGKETGRERIARDAVIVETVSA